VKFGLFYEIQVPRPWDDRSEERALKEALEQIELADRLGYSTAWAVEHHFLEEYSHCSAPELFLTAAAGRTERIRLGHGIVAVLPEYNHPARVAERIATLDLLSGGRVEFGCGETGSTMEIDGFGADYDRKLESWLEVVAEYPRMFVEVPYGGHDGRAFSMPVRNVIPKPRQKPHPPMWGACTRPEKLPLMGRLGLGAMAFGMLEPEKAAEWARSYYDAFMADDVEPVVYRPNPNICFATGFFCAEREEEAIAKGIDGAHFFTYSLGHWLFNDHVPGKTNMWESFIATRESQGLSREAVTAEGGTLSTAVYEQNQGAKLMGSLQRSVRGAVGTPDQLREFARRWEAAGADELMLVAQTGGTKHEDICDSLELFGRTVMPEFLERDEQARAAKAKRLAEAFERHEERRPAEREIPETVVPPRPLYAVPSRA
jgi:alkanesulfonate monooxygenase SsuD/methylene tetrahydromethanopterin reductase-like flavin-dependent oxidoreductase (luciferase family)